ncbi:hypothetical protein HS125_11380 [bacterium]|nr:hypothetical protein [bacterium]
MLITPEPPKKGIGMRLVQYLLNLPASAAFVVRISVLAVGAVLSACASLVAIIGLVRLTVWLVHLIVGGR